MFGHIFYHKTIKKVVASFGKLFDGMTVIRTDKLGAEVKRFVVPLAYGPREKYLIRLADDPTLQRPIDMVVPRMSFQIVNVAYDGKRKLRTIGKNHKSISGDNSKLLREFNPVPYNIDIDLSIMSKTIDDSNQIVEQILPFFTPDYTITVNSIPELELIDDFPVVLNRVNMEDNYDDDWKERRNIIWTLNFTVKAYLYGPISSDPVILKASQDYLVPIGDPADKDVQDATARVVRYQVQPNPLDADPDSDYGYTESIQEFNDGKKYNPETGNDEDV